MACQTSASPRASPRRCALDRDAARCSYFGFSLALALPVLVVGTKGHGGACESAGAARAIGHRYPRGPLRAAYVFTTSDDGSTWSETTKLTKTGNGDDDEDNDDNFGRAVAATSSIIVVGARGEGRAYVFQLISSAWTLTDSLEPSSTDDSTKFGDSVAISPDGTVIAVGASGENVRASAHAEAERRADARVTLRATHRRSTRLPKTAASSRARKRSRVRRSIASGALSQSVILRMQMQSCSS